MSDYTRIIDVSMWQANIDWAAVKSAGIGAAIMRIGVSTRKNGVLTLNKDSYFDKNYQGTKDNGIPIGVYYYSHALNERDAEREAEYVLTLLRDKQFEYPIYYDVEEKEQFALGKTKLSKIIEAFLLKVESAGYWVGLYGSRCSLTDYVDTDIRERFAIWVADWRSDRTLYNGAYGIWQTGTGRVNGISGDVDIDRGYVDYPSLIKGAGLNGFSGQPEPEPAPTPEPEKPEFSNPYPIPTRTLKKGDKGDDVKWMQYNLVYLGFDCGSYGVDGDLGGASDKALREFQKANGLTVDGLCGPMTRATMISLTTPEGGFIPRLTKPEKGNPYYNTVGNGGYSTAIKGSPLDADCDVYGNCVGHAAGRFNEIIGAGKFVYFNYPPNAENFYDVAISSGLEVSQTPKLGAIMCWQKGATRTNADGAGHVAVVEQIISEAEVVTSESGYGCANPFWIQNRKKGDGNWGAGGAYKFLGFILNPAVK